VDGTLIEIARAARREMTTFAKKHPEIGDWEDLSCYCGISSYFLKILAQKFDYRLALVVGLAFPFGEPDRNDLSNRDINHCWNVYGGNVIDITATQFGSDHSVHIDEVENDTHYAINVRHQTGKVGLPKIFGEWPSDQSPVRYVEELQSRATRLAGEIKIAA